MCILNAIVGCTIKVYCNMFLINPPTSSLSYFIPYVCLVVLRPPPLFLLAWHPFCVQNSSSCECLTCEGYVCRIHVTNVNYYCYIFSPLYQLATMVSLSCIVYMVILSFWLLSPWWVEILPLPLGCTIPQSGLAYGIPNISIEWTGYRALS